MIIQKRHCMALTFDKLTPMYQSVTLCFWWNIYSSPFGVVRVARSVKTPMNLYFIVFNVFSIIFLYFCIIIISARYDVCFVR